MGETGFELLEHTADVGIRSWGPTPEGAFEQAAWGLVELLDIKGESEGDGDRRTISISSPDLPALLVDFLNELVFLHDSEAVGIAAVRVLRSSDTELQAELETVPLTRVPEGTVVKAATYHRLRVERQTDGRVETQVFLDV